MHPRLLDLRATAALVAVTPQTARNWAHAGRIPGVRVGGSWRFWRPAVLAAVVGPESAQRSEAREPEVDEPGIVGIKQLADLLGVHDRTVNELLRRGQLPGRKIGNSWRLSWPDIRDAIAEGRPLVPAATEAGAEAPASTSEGKTS
ncbi:helix-turn-helix domain-containing protein [Pseudokineococcus marinus]|uniref:Helix-turn-helix domain-containing protein n=1 Tax=Pseudokineococcus marinus TaxID=351215 RepID=A0A849BJR8_9ACTN|nr:helix-turn-helix domain-containing protein [Pseudokineococcus marinus]NNH22871.1 helix-turn-helix domain-containing protein [Pseudokineococcus marinus]